MSTRISIVNVKDYDNIPTAVVGAIKLLDDNLHFNFLDSNKILLKPNLLRSNKDACTQISFVEGVIFYLKELGVSLENVFIGDSPGQIKKFASDVAKDIGLYEICEENGIQFVDFEKDAPIIEIIQDAIRMKDFRVAKVVHDCDILINMPRLKTHIEATITGAIKNYWGIIPGGLKAKYHLLGKNAQQFGEVLADNYSWVRENKPNRLTVYDLDKIMEGSGGPAAGKISEWNLILVGTDELALDTIALEIGKYKAKNVPHLKSAMERGLGIGDLGDIEIIGISLEEAKEQVPRFNVPGNKFSRFISYMATRTAYKYLKKIPKLNKTKCIMCGECAQICPAEAIDFKKNNYPIFSRKICISCLCCAEMCPETAIEGRNRGIKGLFD